MRFPQASFAIFTVMFTPDLVAGQTGTSTITLGDVNITQTAGVALSTENVLTSVDVLGSDQVRDKNVMNSWQLLGQMPGIQLTETGQGAESGKVSFRAFNGEGYITSVSG